MRMTWMIIGGTATIACLSEAYLFTFPVYCREVFYESCFIQPPSILPVSSNFSERAIYFFVSNDLISHAIWRKNLSKSSLVTAPFILISLSCRVINAAEKIYSIISRKNKSIFAPSVYREVFGMCGTNSCHSLYTVISFWITGN